MVFGVSGIDDAIVMGPRLHDPRFGLTYSASELVDAFDRRVSVPDEATLGGKSETVMRAKGIEDGEGNVTP